MAIDRVKAIGEIAAAREAKVSKDESERAAALQADMAEDDLLSRARIWISDALAGAEEMCGAINGELASLKVSFRAVRGIDEYSFDIEYHADDVERDPVVQISADEDGEVYVYTHGKRIDGQYDIDRSKWADLEPAILPALVAAARD